MRPATPAGPKTPPPPMPARRPALPVLHAFAPLVRPPPIPSAPAARPAALPAGPAANDHGHATGAPRGREPAAKTNDDDALDPLSRHAAQLAPPMHFAAPPPLAVSSPAAPVASAPPALSLEDILPQLVRKLALAGDGKRATVRVEIGSGALAGATVVVSNESGGIRVDVEAPPGTDHAAWSARIRSRLEAKGLRVDSVAVG